MNHKIKTQASTRLSSGFGVFADAYSEAAIALKAVAKILGQNFATNRDTDDLGRDRPVTNQQVIWRTAKYQARLSLDTENDVLEFQFFDKGNAGSFSAEGYNAAELLKDIRYNVSSFKPQKKVGPEVQALRQKFESIK